MPNSPKIQSFLPDYSWLQEKGKDCILSPDCDGFLCGLFMSFFYDWKIKGFYDGSALFIEENTSVNDCVFLDIEICRPNIRSVGQHLLYYNVNKPLHNQVKKNFINCLSPNNIRNHDFQNFMRKFPLATIHLLMALLPQKDHPISPEGFVPLYYVDGTFKNLLNYPENCFDWLQFLDAENNVLSNLFYGEYPFSLLMSTMCDFFNLLNKMKLTKQEKPDKLPLTKREEIINIENNTIVGTQKAQTKQEKPNKLPPTKRGEIINIENNAIVGTQKAQTEKFLHHLSNFTGWHYNHENWTWENYKTYSFETGNCKPTLGRFQDLMLKNPLSWAITRRSSMSYTIDNHNIF